MCLLCFYFILCACWVFIPKFVGQLYSWILGRRQRWQHKRPFQDSFIVIYHDSCFVFTCSQLLDLPQATLAGFCGWVPRSVVGSSKDGCLLSSLSVASNCDFGTKAQKRRKGWRAWLHAKTGLQALWRKMLRGQHWSTSCPTYRQIWRTSTGSGKWSDQRRNL